MAYSIVKTFVCCDLAVVSVLLLESFIVESWKSWIFLLHSPCEGLRVETAIKVLLSHPKQNATLMLMKGDSLTCLRKKGKKKNTRGSIPSTGVNLRRTKSLFVQAVVCCCSLSCALIGFCAALGDAASDGSESRAALSRSIFS